PATGVFGRCRSPATLGRDGYSLSGAGRAGWRQRPTRPRLLCTPEREAETDQDLTGRLAAYRAAVAGPWTRCGRPVTLTPAADGPNRLCTFAFAHGGKGGPHPVRDWAVALGRQSVLEQGASEQERGGRTGRRAGKDQRISIR